MEKMRGRAFTLVEILVVTGIVAVLAALVFGVFGTTKQIAKVRVCASNLQQIGLATGLYTNDHDGQFPATVNAVERLDRGLRVGREEDQNPDVYPTPREALMPYTKSVTVFHCPEDNGARIGRINSDGQKAIRKPGPLHGFNGDSSYLFADLLASQNPASWHHPERDVWACDTSEFWHDRAADTPLAMKGKVNALHYDLHVSEGEYVNVQWQDSE